MTFDEKTASLTAELRLIMEWEEAEIKKVTERLEKEGKALGLDGYPEEFLYIRETRNSWLNEVLKKYSDLPSGTKLNF